MNKYYTFLAITFVFCLLSGSSFATTLSAHEANNTRLKLATQSDIIFNPEFRNPIAKPVILEYEQDKYSNLLHESQLRTRNYNVLRYDLTLDWSPLFSGDDDTLETTTWTGKTAITLVIDSTNADILVFDSELTHDSIFCKGENLSYTVANGELFVNMDPFSPAIGDTFTLDIYYTGGNLGYGVYMAPKNTFVDNKDDKYDTYTDEKIVYTQCELAEAHYWYPCNDEPYDKAYFTTTTTVPKGVVVSSNGTLAKIDTTDGKQTYYFESLQHPMANYLVVVNASKFTHYTDIYNNGTREIPLNYYVWENDVEATDGRPFNTKKAFKDDSLMLAILENLLVPFPYESYGITAVQPYKFGGMEHQTMTTVSRRWLANSYPAGIFHEMGHQWLGDLITCATWHDIWINEGGATWLESFWAKELYDDAGYYNNQETARQYYLYYSHNTNVMTIPIYYIPENDIFSNAAILAYQKASWIYNMLYQWTDHDFIYALRAILNKHAYTSIETEDFVNTLKQLNFVFPIDIDTFFDQWVYSAGHPIYDISGNTETTDNAYNNRLHIEQTQEGENIPEVFDVMQKMIFTNENDSTQRAEFVFRNNTRSLDTNFVTDFEPTHCHLDYTYTLCETSQPITVLTPLSVADDNQNNVFIAPSPIIRGENCRLTLIDQPKNDIDVSIFNYTGEKLLSQNYRAGSSSVELQTADLISGIYLARIVIGNQTFVEKIIVQ